MHKEQLQETVEKAGEALHSMEEPSNGKDHEKFRFFPYLALSTAILAVLGAIAGLQETLMTSKMLIAKNEEILNQTHASNMWSYYQAKSIKENIYRVGGEVQPKKKTEYEGFVAKYEQQQEEIAKQAKHYENTAVNKSKESSYYLRKHHILTYSVTAFQIAIALASVAALMKSVRFWIFAMAVGSTGAAVFIYGMIV
ncbi:MAG: DUF4337 domain-containing protein [Nitrospirota bacterium]